MADYRRGYRDDYGQQNRYSGSYGNDRDDYGRSYRGDRGYRDERGAMDRAGDEIQSWFGDDDAERRRRMDERRDPDTNHFGGRDRDDYGRNRSRGYSDDDYRDSGYRGGYDRGGYGGGSDRDDRGWGYSDRSDRYGGERGYGSSYRRDLSDDDLHEHESRRSHYGKGPRNDTRSKERVQERVSDELHDDHDLDASDIEVKTSDNGEVTLEGTTDSRWSKRRAENCAYRVRNVRHVQNNIRVEHRDDESSAVARDPDATNRPTTGRKTATKT
jgi:osmotically-inducible protein OsmY